MVRYRHTPLTPASVIAGEAAIVTPLDSRLHILNGVGTRIWQLCDADDGITSDELVTQLEAEFDADVSLIRADTEAFLSEALAMGLIEAIGG